VRRKIIILLLTVLLCVPSVISAEKRDMGSGHHPVGISSGASIRNPTEEVVIVPDSDPYYGIMGTYAACWYDVERNESGLNPLLVHQEGILSDAQTRFLNQYLGSNGTVLTLGESVDTPYTTTEILGGTPSVAIDLATHVFSMASTVLILPYLLDDAVMLSCVIMATPLASYLNIPVLIYDDNNAELQQVVTQLSATDAIVIGDMAVDLPGISITRLQTTAEIQAMVLALVAEQFSTISYITLTNPADTIPLTIQNDMSMTFTDHIQSTTVTILSREWVLSGVKTQTYDVVVPDGINRVHIEGHISKQRDTTVLYGTLYDPQGNVVAYANSFASHRGEVILETLTCNASGVYTLEISAYNGIKGGYFLQRGFSYVDADLEITVNSSSLATPHYPLIPKLSVLAPYLASAHGGIIIAESEGELTSDTYVESAAGCGTGPWYNESLTVFNNQQVNYTVETLESTLSLMDDYGLRDRYLGGPAWLAIVGDTNMIPMYYYGPSQEDIPDRGLPSDNLYTLNSTLSVGRVIGWDVADVSVMLCRTFFYETVCGQPSGDEGWHDTFNFIFGEGFGETGGIFHQIPYAREIRAYGFNTQVYGDLRNGRGYATLFDVYTGANYIEYLGHGDWFWFPPSLYGLDIYSKAIDVAHAQYWVYEKPSVFLSAACLMGRVDGLLPSMNIGLTMLHAGCNGFIGATRETGEEAGLTVLENHLIVDDMSLGEALRGEKQVDTELPTFYVRVLYGDPAFNPYEPNNGFSDQGIAHLHS
jgi:hypothetical protein